MNCDQCEALMINGVFCHETGCPNSHKTYRDGEWVKLTQCLECGSEVGDGGVCDCQVELSNETFDSQSVKITRKGSTRKGRRS